MKETTVRRIVPVLMTLLPAACRTAPCGLNGVIVGLYNGKID